jgi:hypothetical protein
MIFDRDRRKGAVVEMVKLRKCGKNTAPVRYGMGTRRPRS